MQPCDGIARDCAQVLKQGQDARALAGIKARLAANGYLKTAKAEQLDQQSKVAGRGKLEGFFYIRFTGDVTADGVPIAKHADCNKVSDQCIVGWILDGIPIQATYLGHEMGSHPEWYSLFDDFMSTR